jgi:serine/threonine protein kinase/WD40 repeat protein
MTMNESSTTPYSVDGDDSTGGDVDEVVIRFLKELEGSGDPREILARFCDSHPSRVAEFRALAGARRVLVMSEPVADHPPEHSGRLGDFQIVRQFAQGGMGAIYEAVQEPFGRRVAVKTIRDDRRHLSDGARERFFREQDVLARLHHTHIVPIHAGGRDGDLEYFAMPYIEGAALHHVVRLAWHHGATRPSEETPSLAELARSSSDGSPGPGADGPSAETMPIETGGEGSVSDRARLSLSTKYLRSVAKVMADAADAVYHAHQAGIIHRDLKPSNIMVDCTEHVWVLDFGLASIRAVARPDGDAHDGRPPGPDPPQSGLMGTPNYMAPEQFSGRADARTDIWGLGVTLYELLTLHRAFENPRDIPARDPVRPREQIANLPLDLDSICWKALRKDPAHRYERAQDLADDLRHWLRHEPTSVWRTTPRRLLLWSRRNRGWAVAIVVAMLAIVGLGIGGAVLGGSIAAAALQREQAKERELTLLEIQRLRMAPHRDTWFGEVWGKVRQASTLRPADEPLDRPLQKEAVGCLVGLDAETIREFKDFGARSLAFDAKGRLLMGGVTDTKDSRINLTARLWDGHSPLQAEDLGVIGDGPVGFRDDATPIQLIVNETARTLTLTNLARREPIHRFEIPGRLGIDETDARPAVAMTPDGSLIGAAVRQADDTRLMLVWDGVTGRDRRRLAGRVCTLAFSPDGALMAGGDELGRITVWSLATGQAVASLSAGRNRINVLAFGRNPLLGHGGPDPLPARRRWQLAAGDMAGTVTVWDLGSDVPRVRSILRGSSYGVYALAFSPDGALLASAGRSHARLWDPATGQLLLKLAAGNYVHGLTFSLDGGNLAVGVDQMFADPGRVFLLALHDGRGVRSLRGLAGSLVRTWLSPDDRLVVSMSDEWKIAVWERETGRLVAIFEAPPGIYSDNTGLAISPDNRRVAFSSHRQARLWNIDSGRELGSWKLPIGLQDRLAFKGTEQLMLARAETHDSEVAPYGGTDPEKYPRHCAVYDLLGPQPTTPIRRIRDLNRAILSISLSPDGTAVVLDGYSGYGKQATRVVNAYELSTGARMWTLASRLSSANPGGHQFDPTGKLVVVCIAHENDGDVQLLIEMPSGQFRGQVKIYGLVGPGAKQWISNTGNAYEQGLFEQGRVAPLFAIDLRTPSFLLNADCFSRDGRYIVSTNPLGDTVTVCDLEELQRRLAEFHLGW